ncbi:DUF4279 domain-containing protein, partial [Proteus mirabilis]|uniref:DUF4279 domain-containing protein n=3 Tax=Pseudomonadota TaxID=1224 RepID=UPI0013D16768
AYFARCPTGSWRIRAERCSPGDLDGQIRALPAPLTRDFDAWRALSARFGGRIFAGLFLAEWNEGMRLEADTLAALAERGLYIDLDNYAATGAGE